MAIDDLLGDMHQDELRVIRALRGKIDDHVLAQHEASLELIATINGHIKDLTDDINLLKPNGGMPDLHRDQRQRLEDSKRREEKELAQVRIQFLQGLQPSLMYGLHLLREELEEEQSYEQVKSAFYDARPHQQ